MTQIMQRTLRIKPLLEFLRKTTCILMSVFLISFFLASCGMKQANDSLTVFYYYFDESNVADFNDRWPSHPQLAKKAIEIFERETGIDVVVYNEEMFSVFGSSPDDREAELLRLEAEIMAGVGPDLFIFGTNTATPTVYKQMDAGAYLDINELIAKDKGFSLDDYEKDIMDAGIFGGKRYLMPLSYTVPLLFTSPEKLNKFGLSREDFMSYEGFLDSSLSLHEQDVSLFVDWGSFSDMVGYGFLLSEMLDYERKTVNTDIPTVDKALQVLDVEYRFYEEREAFGIDHSQNAADEKGLFYLESLLHVQMRYLESVRDEDSVEMLSIPGAGGQSTAVIPLFAAISSSSQNIGNAWEFMKILLSDELQSGIATRVGVKSDCIDANIANALTLCRTGPESYLAEQLKAFYKGYDNVTIEMINPAVQCVIVLTGNGYGYWEKELGDINMEELKERAENELMIWLME